VTPPASFLRKQESMASGVAKVPAITLGFWLIKILATTLGETGGDAVTMSMNLGYLTGTAIFATLFTACVLVQIRAKQFHPLVYWTTIVASTTVGTTLADFVTRSIGIGYTGGAALLLALVIASLWAWQRTLGTVSVASVGDPKSEWFYWTTITFSQTLGTALGDWVADTAGVGYVGGIVVFGTALAIVAFLHLRTHVSKTILFLGSLHPHASAGRGGRRLPRQAHRERRPRPESIRRLRVARGRHPGVRAPATAARSGTRALTIALKRSVPLGHLLARLLRTRGADGGVDLLHLFRRRQHGRQPERLDPQLPRPAFRVVDVVVFVFLDFVVRGLQGFEHFRIALSVRRDVADQLPVRMVLGFGEHDAFARDQLGRIRIAGGARLLHRLHQRLADVRTTWRPRRVLVGSRPSLPHRSVATCTCVRVCRR
jgi:uncharacterized membrane-anchored protein